MCFAFPDLGEVFSLRFSDRRGSPYSKWESASFQRCGFLRAGSKSWLSPVLGKNDRARCTVCGVDFDVANMGVAAVKSHMGGKKHKLKVSEKAASPMARFVVPQPGSATSSSAAESSDVSSRQPPAVNESAPSDGSNLLCALELRVTNAKLLLLTGSGKSCR